MVDIPTWWMKGDWFDVCSCNVPCLLWAQTSMLLANSL